MRYFNPIKLYAGGHKILTHSLFYKYYLTKILFLLTTSLFVTNLALAQTVSLELGKSEIGLNENYQIVLKVANGRINETPTFPNIPGFRKGRPSVAQNTTIINGQVSSFHSITQYYAPTKKGTFRLAPFSVKVNGKVARSSGATIKVKDAVQRQTYDPFADFFNPWGGSRRKKQQQEFVEVKDDAFFSVSTDKDRVYRGEGFNMSIAFYVAVNNRADLKFYELNDQVTSILKKVKPSNCWEENFEIESITPEYVMINGKSYRQYKFYEAVYYPLNAEDIEVPSVDLKMIKFKVAKNPTFFGQNHKQDFKVFSSKPKKVIVDELPADMNQANAAVGNYRLADYKLNSTVTETGKSFIYKFKIRGEGNISAIPNPTVVESEDFVFYPPSIIQNVNKANGKVYGDKTFEYYIEPQEPGNFNLKDYISWTYFNPNTKQYETLAPDLTFEVKGESLRDKKISRADLGSFYQLIDSGDNTLMNAELSGWHKVLVNIAILLVLLLTAFAVFKK